MKEISKEAAKTRVMGWCAGGYVTTAIFACSGMAAALHSGWWRFMAGIGLIGFIICAWQCLNGIDKL